MKRTRHTPEQVINKLREAETMLAGGRTVAQVLQHPGVSEATFSRWRYQYGGMKSQEDSTGARRREEPKIENPRLKRLVAEREFDIAILRESNDYLGEPQALAAEDGREPRAGATRMHAASDLFGAAAASAESLVFGSGTRFASRPTSRRVQLKTPVGSRRSCVLIRGTASGWCAAAFVWTDGE